MLGGGEETKVRGGSFGFWQIVGKTNGIGGGCGAAPPGAMSAICWNCRGLGNPRTVGTLQKLVLEEDPTLVFLMETKFNVEEMVEIKRKLERSQGLVVPSVRRSGGLALLWKESLPVEVQTFSPRHIDVIISEDDGKKKWRFTGFYGNLETHKREESWSLLVCLSTRCDLPWVCMGDFNEICHRGEKTGGGERPEWQMRAFRAAINRSKLRDMGCVGPEFTWSRRLGTRGWVRERLDRALVSTNWAGLFPGVRLYNRATCSSDHNILILKTLPPRSRNKRQRLFRFEAMWIKKEDCGEVVKEAWGRGQRLGIQNQFGLCMEECRSSLQSWNKTNFGHVGRKIASLSKKLQWLECLPGGVANMEEINETKSELIRMFSVKEEMWKQRSRNCWLKAGDRNTTFFHEKA